jgi:hypothetical protein
MMRITTRLLHLGRIVKRVKRKRKRVKTTNLSTSSTSWTERAR